MNIFGDPWSKFQHGMYFIYISSARLKYVKIIG